MFQTKLNGVDSTFANVLIPSEQGNVSNLQSRKNTAATIGLNPFGTGKCFTLGGPLPRAVDGSLNPFGTGKCFKLP